MTSQDMCAAFKARTGVTAWVSMQHPAGPSIAVRGRDGQVYGIVIPIDDASRAHVADALAKDAGYL